MKKNRTYFFIAISSIALITVLVIQVNWILQTAKIKEKIFNEKANMVLSKTAQVLSSDTTTVKKMEIYVGRNETHKVDSLFTHYMKLYNVEINYYFEVKPNPVLVEPGLASLANPGQPGCYKACIGPNENANPGTVSTKNGLELKLVFPGAEQFIRAEMGMPFISSVILILVVLVMSWRTILSLMKEKEISEHTTDFLNNMTHEFKTPLTNIALAGKMMTKDSNIRQEEKVKHYSGIILEENEKLILQVEQVLSMTALERGEIPLQKTGLDFHQLIRDALKCISIQVENKKGHVQLSLEADAFHVIGDKAHLTNALCNLVDNAVKYCKEKPELSIQTFNNDQHLIVVISDNGIGIEEKYHKKIFDKFFRIPKGDVHDVKGFGIGLAYVKTIIELHGGTIKPGSKKGSGTTFTITLPHV